MTPINRSSSSMSYFVLDAAKTATDSAANTAIHSEVSTAIHSAASSAPATPRASYPEKRDPQTVPERNLQQPRPSTPENLMSSERTIEELDQISHERREEQRAENRTMNNIALTDPVALRLF